MSIITDKNELAVLKQGGHLLAEILHRVSLEAKAGVSTGYLNEFAESMIKKAGALPSFKGYGEPNPYPAALCASINNEVVHGIPGEDIILKEGDIVGLDLGLKYPEQGGLFTDMAMTVGIGKISPLAEKLVRETKQALALAIKNLRPGMTSGDLGYLIEHYIVSQGFSVVRELVGHGVGRAVHEMPRVPNFGREGEGDIFKEGMVIAIEPMVNAGGWQVDFSDNGWDVFTKDGSLSAHFEHTVILTKSGCEIITK